MLRRTIPALPFHIVLLLVALFNALEAGLAHAPARPPQVPAEPGAIAPHSADPFTAQQVRWPFAARDPPPAQRA